VPGCRCGIRRGLAARLRDLIGDEPGLAEKKMFGGLAMLLHGNIAVGVHGEDLIVRTDPAQPELLLAEPGARVFDLTGRPMKGWLLIDPGRLRRRRQPALVGRPRRQVRPQPSTQIDIRGCEHGRRRQHRDPHRPPVQAGGRLRR